jgi:rhodanese-related sulfurtransferase
VKFILNNIWLVLAALVSGAALIWPLISKRLSGIPELGAQAAVALINRRDASILDVREVGEFNAGHLSNAKNIPLAQLEKRAGELEKLRNKPLLLCCQTGNRAHSAAALLKKTGWSEIFILGGGINAWQQASLPLEKK